MDLRMPNIDGAEATRRIIEGDATVRVLVLTASSDDQDVTEALDAGACGVVAKDTPVESVGSAVRAAAAGVAWLSPRAADAVLGRLRRGTHEPDPELGFPDQLSARELDVLRLIARGLENAEIAQTLHISPRTVKNHVSSILGKLGVPNRVRAAIYAVRRGLD
jgi:DNA-binding NarL/FixJ family response regulator